MAPYESDDPARTALPAATEMLRDFVAVASVSTRGELLEEGARHSARLLQDAGLEVAIWADRGAPVVFAQAPAPAGAPTILFYGHYDVQPAEPLAAWETPPFAAQVRDGALYGRGAGDNKGQLLAHIIAVGDLIRAGRLEVGVKFLIEGEEEIGSPHLAENVRQHAAQLAADLAITADAPVHDDGNPVVIFGVRGLLYVELTAVGAPRDLHSGDRGGIAPTPAWELVHALASMRAADGTVTVPGFDAAIRAPTAAERNMLEALPFDRDRLLGQIGRERVGGDPQTSPWESLMFEPALNISGIDSGYSGPGPKTIIPRRAACKIDVRLVADQQPGAIYEALRAHLAEHAPHVSPRLIAAVPPSATDPDTPLARPVIAAVTRAAGVEPWLRPRLGGTTPDFVFTQILGLPSLLVPYGPADMNHHAPNEKMTLEALARGIRCSTAICEELAGYGRRNRG